MDRVAFLSEFLPEICPGRQQDLPRLTGTALLGAHSVGMFCKMYENLPVELWRLERTGTGQVTHMPWPRIRSHFLRSGRSSYAAITTRSGELAGMTSGTLCMSTDYRQQVNQHHIMLETKMTLLNLPLDIEFTSPSQNCVRGRILVVLRQTERPKCADPHLV